MYSINRSQEQAFDLENSNRTFYAIEAGEEAARFHQNSRGAGLELTETAADAPAEQTLALGNTGTVQWTVLGRTTSNSQANQDVQTGTLSDDQLIEIPFFWPAETDISAGIGTPGKITTENFSLTFDRQAFNTDGEATGDQVIPNNFDFGSPVEQPLINWAFSRIDANDRSLTTFIPCTKIDSTGIQASCSEVEDPILCDSTIGPNSGFYCEQHLGESIDSVILNSIPGYIIPGRTETTLSDFYLDNDSGQAQYQLSFQPILSFTSSDGTTKIRGIPWAVEIRNTENGFPKESYDIEILANFFDLQKTFRKTVLRPTALRGLDSLIID